MNRQAPRGVALIALCLAAMVVAAMEIGPLLSEPVQTPLLMIVGAALWFLIGHHGLRLILKDRS